MAYAIFIQLPKEVQPKVRQSHGGAVDFRVTSEPPLTTYVLEGTPSGFTPQK